MREPERIDPNDPCWLASRLSGGEGQVHLEVRAVDRIPERVEEGGVALERADRFVSLVLIREGQRDVVLVLLRVGISRQGRLLDDRDDEEGLEQLPDAVPARPIRRPRPPLYLGPSGLPRPAPRHDIRHRPWVLRPFPGKSPVPCP